MPEAKLTACQQSALAGALSDRARNEALLRSIIQEIISAHKIPPDASLEIGQLRDGVLPLHMAESPTETTKKKAK